MIDRLTTCRECMKPIFFIKTKKGKSMPVNTGKIKIMTEEGEIVIGYFPHWATCTNPNNFRKGSKFFEDNSGDAATNQEEGGEIPLG